MLTKDGKKISYELFLNNFKYNMKYCSSWHSSMYEGALYELLVYYKKELKPYFSSCEYVECFMRVFVHNDILPNAGLDLCVRKMVGTSYVFDQSLMMRIDQ